MDEGKAAMPLEWGDLEGAKLRQWLAGDRPRPLLAIPFGGPIPSADGLGRDFDGEAFHQKTDVWPALFDERPILWHHGKDPTGQTTHAVWGKATNLRLEDDGWWVDAWLKAGDAKRGLLDKLVEQGAKLYGSTAPLKGGPPFYVKGKAGLIDSWAYAEQTLSTSPQNHRSEFGPMKAVLADFGLADINVQEPLRAVLFALDNLGTDLVATSEKGESPAKAGRVLSTVNDAELQDVVDRLTGLLGRARAAMLARSALEEQTP